MKQHNGTVRTIGPYTDSTDIHTNSTVSVTFDSISLYYSNVFYQQGSVKMRIFGSDSHEAKLKVLYRICRADMIVTDSAHVLYDHSYTHVHEITSL